MLVCIQPMGIDTHFRLATITSSTTCNMMLI